MRKIAFLLWSPDISGGTNVIFEHATRMRAAGHEISIITEDKPNPERLNWFPQARDLIWLDYQEASKSSFDLVIATWWRTVFYLPRLRANKYCYFVQSIESRFYSEDQVVLRNLVELTYSLDLNFITEATWIKNYLQDEFEKVAKLVKNGIRKDYFNNSVLATSPRVPGKLRVLVEGPLGVSFKNTELAVELCRASQADEIWLVTSTEIGAYPGVDRLFSRVPISRIGEIYASCDVLIKLSTVEGMFGPPLEIFHTGGTSISYDVTGYDEYIEHERNGLVSFSRNNQEIIDFIDKLKKDELYLSKLKKEAIATAEAWPDWYKSSDEFLCACEEIIDSGSGTAFKLMKSQLERYWDSYNHHISSKVSDSVNTKRLVPLTHEFRKKLIKHLYENHPGVFSFLRKIKWTLKAYMDK
ncbi:glycosyltransferase family 4 protein [Pseudomonas oryzihabitans]|uniref:Glycosyltransferase involved in cell wall biosynthesis n=1 Tax=Pseudomonas oryzihabitans TaxID=47885 RepID=A0AAJ2BHC6_9PSED|nr:glycosyltransferase family 4 protein [Pseudomonas psychrotolerans]MDR6234273.1 glycosyltransferase involved in cell wall biosynthesis [Pseudomonas psychrotolerans]MDR6356610.1 glycosyltransferase involved in cell wall biosynthesis [Pseudomonas psychrotolerans]